jgi:hypothetical protein
MAEPEGQQHAQAHEDIHLPPPSIWPPVLALGIALLLTGLIVNLVMLIVGALITILSIVLWVRDARREFYGLPE